MSSKNQPWRDLLRTQKSSPINHSANRTDSRDKASNPPMNAGTTPRVRSVGGANLYLGTGVGFVQTKLAEGISHLENMTTGLTGITSSPLNKLWRVFIKANPRTIGFPKQYTSLQAADAKIGDIVNQKLARKGNWSMSNILDPAKRPYIATGSISESQVIEFYQSTKVDHTAKKSLKAKPGNNDAFLIRDDGKTITSIKLQHRPPTIAVDSVSNWVSVRSMGRNDPFMIYTGGEETLTFELSWFSREASRRDVINLCRLIESWSKADGYSSSPPTVKLLWGTSDIFANFNYIVQSASYELTNFQDYTTETTQPTQHQVPGSAFVIRGAELPTSVTLPSRTVYKNLGLLPTVATQKIVLKRVSSTNLTHSEMVDMSFLETKNSLVTNQSRS